MQWLVQFQTILCTINSDYLAPYIVLQRDSLGPLLHWHPGVRAFFRLVHGDGGEEVGIVAGWLSTELLERDLSLHIMSPNTKQS